MEVDKILNQDCLIGMKDLPDQSIDMILTDLPYGIVDCAYDKKKFNLAEMWKEFKRIIKPRSAVALFASAKFSYELFNSNPQWYKYKWIWVKSMSTFFMHAKNAPMRKFEEILIFSDGVVNHESVTNKRMKYFPQGVKNKKNPKFCIKQSTGDDVYSGLFEPHYKTQENFPTDVLFFKTPFNIGKSHPNEKPADLLEYLIKTYTSEGEIILDATIGSGSTAVAAINCNRHFVGYEINEKYFATAQKRINDAFRRKVEGLFNFKGDINFENI